jgi:multidrug efflux pump subunit AcrB
MFFAKVQFFKQFGVFLFCTIGFSLLFSLGMFTLLMGLFGPENNNGCLKTLFAKLRVAKDMYVCKTFTAEYHYLKQRNFTFLSSFYIREPL